jgi:hypothetical protein
MFSELLASIRRQSTSKPPESFSTHEEFLRFVRNYIKARVYLEVGVHKGHSLIMTGTSVRLAIGVDPAYEVSELQSKEIVLVKKTSDSFFADQDYSRITRRAVDLTFVDGMHLAEFALRDILNAEKLSTKKSLILVHDIIPTSAEAASRTQCAGCWMGDVYKAVIALKNFRPDLQIQCIEDIPPSGMAVIRNLNPTAPSIDMNEVEAFMRNIDFAVDFETKMRPLIQKYDPSMF